MSVGETTRTILLGPILGLLASTGCPAALDAPSEPDEPRSQADEAGTRPRFARVRVPEATRLLEAPARLVAPGSRVSLDAAVAGRVQRVAVAAGDQVEAGAVLVELTSAAVAEASATITTSRDQLEVHRKRHEQLVALKAKGMVDARAVFELAERIAALQAEHDVARATLSAVGIDRAHRGSAARGRVVVTAPRAGVITSVRAHVGSVVDVGDALVELAGPAPCRIEVLDVRPLPTAGRLTFVGVDGIEIALQPQPVATTTEEALGRTLAWYEPTDGLPRVDGLRGRVTVDAVDAGLLQIPFAALRLADARAWVFARREDDVVPVAVDVARSDTTLALVRSDALHPDDEIAIDVPTVLSTPIEEAAP